MAVVKVIELLGESGESWECAARQIVAKATNTLHRVTFVYIKELQTTVDPAWLAAGGCDRLRLFGRDLAFVKDAVTLPSGPSRRGSFVGFETTPLTPEIAVCRRLGRRRTPAFPAFPAGARECRGNRDWLGAAALRGW